MKAFKKFKSIDTSITPFTVNKKFNIKKGEMESLNIFLSEVNDSFNEEYYNLLKHLYYSNYEINPKGDTPKLPEMVEGVTPEYDVLIGDTSSSGRYYNYLQTSLPINRNFRSDSKILLIKIPQNLFGETIKRETFKILSKIESIKDDGEGNLRFLGKNVGDIIYSHGFAVIYLNELNELLQEFESTYIEFINSQIEGVEFESTYTIFETQYKCIINSNEFNSTLNPSTLKEDTTSGEIKKEFLSPEFTPYVTTVGLYNDNHELLAVTKLSTPLPLSKFNDTTIIINIDK